MTSKSDVCATGAKSGTAKIHYHEISAHKEQFAITTDGKNGHCPMAQTGGELDNGQPSHDDGFLCCLTCKLLTACFDLFI